MPQIAENERSYHVFYYLLLGTTNERDRAALKLGKIDSYQYMKARVSA
jgi:myosin heavy subunit